MAARRIHTQTNYGVAIIGGGNSGKSTLLHLYRQINHKNSFYLRVDAGLAKESQIGKIDKSFQIHGRNVLGARINYKETIVIVEDVHMASPDYMEPLTQILSFNKWKSSGKEADYCLKGVKMMLTGQSTPLQL